MRKLFAVILLAFVSFSMAMAEAGPMEVTLDEIPSTIDEFVEMRDELAVTATGGAAMFVVAMILYEEDEELGLEAFTAILVNDGTMLTVDSEGYKGYAPNWNTMYLINQIDYHPYLGRSYIDGATPDNAYEIGDPPYTVNCMTNRYSTTGDTEIKIFVYCGGADSPRPLIMEQNTRGLWKTSNISSLVVGIREPVVSDDGDDL